MQSKRVITILLGLSILMGGLLFAQTVLAQVEPGVNLVGNVIALPADDPRIIAARIVRAALGFLGIVALVIVLYGGFVWMTSGGNEEKITKAKKILTNGLIGLIIIVMAFGITQFVINALLGRYTPSPPGPPPEPPVIGRYSGALGNGIVESHYPPRGGTGIPRNTKIIVTFKEQMLLESIIEGYDDKDTADICDDTVKVGGASQIVGGIPRLVGGTDQRVHPKAPCDPPHATPPVLPLKSENIRIFQSAAGETGAGTPPTPNYLSPAEVRVTFTLDLKTFVFDPVDYLGSPTQNIWYTTALKEGLKKDDGTAAFGTGAFRDGYAWEFEVSTFVDTTPPQVESTVPGIMDMAVFDACVAGGRTRVDCGAWPRNVLVQINFDEAMDPTTVSGESPPFNMIEIKANGNPIDGTWTVGNQYKTAEFRTNDKCGVNSCGGDVYCLPPDARIEVLVKAATLSIDDPQDPAPPEAEWPYDGTTDVVGNSLDGNKNGTAQGSERDDARFVGEPPVRVDIPGQVGHDHYGIPFATSSTIDLTPPHIEHVEPGPGAGNVRPFDIPVEMIFSKPMSVGSFTTENIILEDNQRAECAVWFTLGGQGLDSSNNPIPPSANRLAKHKAIMYHGPFIESTEAPDPAPICADGRPVDKRRIDYFPRVTHRVKDLFQNCFFEPVGPTGGTQRKTLPFPQEPWE